MALASRPLATIYNCRRALKLAKWPIIKHLLYSPTLAGTPPLAISPSPCRDFKQRNASALSLEGPTSLPPSLRPVFHKPSRLLLALTALPQVRLLRSAKKMRLPPFTGFYYTSLCPALPLTPPT